MNWFEQVTGLDPDASTGTFEAMLVAIAAIVISRRAKPSAR